MARIALVDEPDVLGFVTDDCSRIGKGLRAHVGEHATIGAFEPYALLKFALNPPTFI